jgi:aconitate hydratase
MARYLAATGRATLAELADRHAALLCADPEVESQPERFFDRVLEIDLGKLEPHVVGPHTPDLARPVSRMAADVREKGYPAQLSSCLIGSCTNSSYEDLSRAADVARQATRNGLRAKTTLWVTPGSEQIHQTIRRDGQLDELAAIGGVVLANACGPCIGQWRRDDVQKGVANSILTSFNRNFPKRNDGSADTQAFIASPEIVVAYALAGRLDWNPLTDAIEGPDGKRVVLAPPGPAPELPERGFVESSEGYLAPPADRRRVAVEIAPGSDRLAFLEPFPAWNGADYVELPILLKARGKCTTDHISMAGPWLRFRGHLDKISDNLFIGATNAFTGKTGEGRNVVSGESGVPFPKLARDYKARGLPWVVIGDQNYGEGSSREHAAMEPRWLGGVAVIVRSFARIHETNLKKQGLLPLTFVNPADYEKVREDDRVSILGLASLAPGQELTVRLHHADGTRDEIRVRHTFNAEQIGWFKAGSALNVLRR